MMLSFLMPPVFADEMTANTEKNPPTATSSAKSAEKHNAAETDTSDDVMDVTALEGLELDDEAKAMALEVQKLQLEVTKLELLHKKNLMDMQAAREKLTLENEMQQAEETKLQAKLTTAKARLELENALHTEQQKQIHAQLNAEHEKMTLLNTLQEDQNKQQELKIATEVWKFNTSVLDLKLQKEKLELQLALKDKKQDWENRVAADPEYLRDPFVNGKLTISDRRIELNGVIWEDTAKHIIEQIEFYNNKNAEYPIFLVIDTCYGGSVMEGMQILKAMHNSRSPVYVVVKSFSASMCAVITTLANQSFALPDAVFIHHQVWNLSFGNRTEQREQLKILEEWTERLLRPVAEKMGLNLDEFIKQMYVHNSVGDWMEFADAAVKLKWVNHVVTDIRETGYLNKPDSKLTTEKEENGTEERIDEQGKRYVKVPRLRPLDVYHLHNSDNYYRN
jgi:ATP-dependent Clp protease protease subunit